MEVLIESKKVRLSPRLIIILVTALTLGLPLPSRAENKNFNNIKSNKIIVANGAALLKDIEQTHVAQNFEDPPAQEPFPSDSDTDIDPNLKLPEFQPSQPESTPQNPGDVPSPEQNENSEESQDPRVLVAEVVVEGASEELKDIVYATISTEPGRTTTRTQLQEDVNAVYATGFFQNVEVTPSDTPLGVRITFVVESNPILNKVAVVTVPEREESQVLPPEKITEFFGESYGQILNLRELQAGIIKVNEWYSENGYELAQVVGSPQVSPEGEVTLILAEGIIEDIKVRYFDEDDEPIDG